MGSPDKHVTTKIMYDQANQRLREWDALRKKQEPLIRNINKVHKALLTPESGDKISSENCSKLKHYYAQAKLLAEKEESLLTIVAQQLDVLVSPGGMQHQLPPHRKKPASSTGDIKRKRINSSSNDSPRMMSSPAVSRTPSGHLSISVGDQVAAKVSSENDNHQWIVVKVTRIDREGSRFEVVDEDLEEEMDGGGGVRTYKLPFTCIIPFPKVDASAVPDYPLGSHVLAVYPGTTSLYKASVVGPQRKKMKPDDQLILEFDGDEEEGVEGLPQRPVPLNRVVTLPDGYRQMISI